MSDLPPILRFEPATPEYVLGVLRDGFRDPTGLDYGDHQCSLRLDDTIREMDELAPSFWFDVLRFTVKERLGIQLSAIEWRALLYPIETRTLRDVCVYFAERVQQPRILPAHLVGPACRPAGAFIAVRQLMEHAGADVSHLAPSTPLQAYAGREPFHRALGVVAPGAMPSIIYRSFHILWRLGASAMLVAALFLAIGFACLAFQSGLGSLGVMLMVGAVPLFYAGTALIELDTALTPDDDLSFGGLRTFRDLAVFIADHDAKYDLRHG